MFQTGWNNVRWGRIGLGMLGLVCMLSLLIPVQAQAQSEQEHKGLVQMRPNGSDSGTWKIGETLFTANSSTEIRTDKGPLVVGVCAEVEYIVQGAQNIATKIASKSADDCFGDDEGNELEHYGLIQDLPIGGGIGDWTIGGMVFQATDATTFETDKGPLTIGVCAEVEYVIAGNGNIAAEIKSESLDDCAQDNEQEVHGTVDSMPGSGLLGTWTVNGVDYEATTTTQFEQEDGPLGPGACVEVEFIVTNGQNIASEIKTDDDCPGSGHFGTKEVRGILEAFPAGLVGTWVINGVTYEASATTEFETERGEFATGICVEVEFTENGGTRTAQEIKTRSADDCSGPGLEPVMETKGLIEAMPNISTTGSFSGTWTVNGVQYQATLQTRFEQDHGPFEIGRCVQVKYRLDGDTRLATRIKTKRQHSCSDSDDDNEVYGTISALPDVLNDGVWDIGGLPYQVNSATQLEDSPFFVGLLVEVHFTVSADGTRTATKIEGKHGVDDDDQALAVVYGKLEVMPSGGLSGTWKIGGEVYQATANTKFEEDEGPFALGACVKVRYRVEGATKTAVKIETESPGDCPDDNGATVNRAVGFVDKMPPNGFIGTWLIGGMAFEVKAATELEEEHGALVEGAFVKVKYVVLNGVKVAKEIETHVPAGAGSLFQFGTLQITTLRQTAADAANEVWQVDGQAYTILDTTLLDDDRADLTNGQKVLVNAYEENGTRIATQVTALGAGNILYLPVVIR